MIFEKYTLKLGKELSQKESENLNSFCIGFISGFHEDNKEFKISSTTISNLDGIYTVNANISKNGNPNECRRLVKGLFSLLVEAFGNNNGDAEFTVETVAKIKGV